MKALKIIGIIALAIVFSNGLKAQANQEREYRLAKAKNATKIADAEKEFRYIMKLNPHDTSALKDLAWIYVQYTFPAYHVSDDSYKRIDTALSVCDTLIKWDPKCKECYKNKAIIESKKARVEDLDSADKLKYAKAAIEDINLYSPKDPLSINIKNEMQAIINEITYKD